MLDCWRGRGKRNKSIYYICNFKSTNKLLNRNFDHFTFRKHAVFETSQSYTSCEQTITEFRGKCTEL